jgi:PAS domain S-box-containing protein
MPAEALRTTEATLRGILDAATEESIWLFDHEGKILMANATAARRFGKSPEEMIGRSTADFVPTALNESRLTRLREVLETGRALDFEDQRDGFHFHHSVRPVTDDGGVITSVACYSRDITAVGQVADQQEALRQNEEKFRIMGEILPYGVWLCDAEWKSEYVSPSFLELINMTMEEHQGFGWASRLVPEDLPCMMEKWLECVKTGKEWDSEHRIIDRHGDIKTILTRGRPVRDQRGRITAWAGVNLDITQRKRSEEALQVATERALFFSTALEDSSQPFAAGFADGTLLNFNKAFVDLTGYTEPEIRSASWQHDLTPVEWQEHEAKVLQKLHETGEPQLYEKEYLRKDGSRVPLEIKVHLRQMPDGSHYYYSFITDVTERNRAAEKLMQVHNQLEQRVAERTAQLEETIRELQEKERLLIQQSRLAAMGEMIDNIAHQWRQPLHALGLMVQQLQIYHELGSLDGKVVEESVTGAMKLIEHMSQTIDDFRDFLKPNREKVLFRLSDVVNTTIELVKPSFKYSNVAIEVAHRDEPLVYGCRSEYSQVIINILNNAKEVLTERNVAFPSIVITTSVSEGRSLLTISDNAGGIPLEIIDRIFEPNFSTKAGGTGIGLFMSKGIIEKGMDGTLRVRNTSSGAEFQVLV